MSLISTMDPVLGPFNSKYSSNITSQLCKFEMILASQDRMILSCDIRARHMWKLLAPASVVRLGEKFWSSSRSLDVCAVMRCACLRLKFDVRAFTADSTLRCKP